MEQRVGGHTLHTCTRAHTCTRTPTFTPPLSASPARIRKAFSAEDELDNYSVTPAPNFSVFVLGHNWEFLLGSQLGSFSDWHCLCTSPRDSPLPELRSPHSPAEPDKSFPQRVCLRLRRTPPNKIQSLRRCVQVTQSVLFTAAFPASAFFPGHKHFSSTISIQTKSKDNQGGPLHQRPQTTGPQ